MARQVLQKLYHPGKFKGASLESLSQYCDVQLTGPCSFNLTISGGFQLQIRGTPTQMDWVIHYTTLQGAEWQKVSSGSSVKAGSASSLLDILYPCGLAEVKMLKI
ncbi:uncharacterized protein LOC144321120 [Canis aureus]